MTTLSKALAQALMPPLHDEALELQVALKPATSCDCHHDYSPLEHYLPLPTVNVLSGDVKPLSNHASAEPCFVGASWIATIRGESPDGYVPPSTRYLCPWCKDHWLSHGDSSNRFELLK